MKRPPVLAFCSSNPASHKIRDITRSSVVGGRSPVLRATRLWKIVPLGISSPIFFATQNRPVGVFMLLFSVPTPNRDVDTAGLRIGGPFCVNVSLGSRIDIWIFVI